MSGATQGGTQPAAIRHLSVGDVLRAAALSVWISRIPVLICLLVWIAAETALNFLMTSNDLGRTILFSLIGWGLIDIRELRGLSYSTLTTAFEGLPNYAARAVMMASLLLIVLKGTRSLAEIGTARAALSLFGVNLIWAILFVVSDWLAKLFDMTVSTSGREELVFVVSVVTIVIAFVWLLARFSMIYPLCAVDRAFRPVAAWRLAKGRSLRLFALVMLLILLFGIARGLAEALLFDEFASERFGQEWLLRQAFGDAVFVSLSLAILMVVFAATYTRLSGYPAVGIPGAERTPEQLADTFD